jgi:hypothetical protein
VIAAPGGLAGVSVLASLRLGRTQTTTRSPATANNSPLEDLTRSAAMGSPHRGKMVTGLTLPTPLLSFFLIQRRTFREVARPRIERLVAGPLSGRGH